MFSADPRRYPSVVGFALSASYETTAIESAIGRALQHTPWLTSLQVVIGDTTMHVWGHAARSSASMIETTSEGAAFIVGKSLSPTIRRVIGSFVESKGDRLTSEGRLLLVHAHPSGDWTVRNDWAGTVPVYYTAKQGLIVSTLEPAVVAGASISPSDVTETGIVSLLTHGYFIGDRTLYGQVRALKPDSILRRDGSSFTVSAQHSVGPSDSRLAAGWNDLVEECSDLTMSAVRGGLAEEPAWTLPLSSGLDSRFLAIGAAELGLTPDTWTFGQEGWLDPTIARRVARVLDFPWTFVELGADYLPDWTRYWADWFGTSMHFHGMYQMPLLAAMGVSGPPTAVGFAGDPLGGAQTDALSSGPARSVRQRFVAKWSMWNDLELRGLLRFDPSEAISDLETEFSAQEEQHAGAAFQRLWLIYQRNHTARFITYHPSTHDAWRGVSTPFVNRALANFTLSLPRLALDGRRLQIAALRRVNPKLGTIAGSFGAEPAAPSGAFYVRKTLADVLPRRFKRGPLLREFAPTPNSADQNSLRRHGRAALWPLSEASDALGDWLDMSIVARVEAEAASGSLGAFARLQAVQALALAVVPDSAR